MRVLMISGSLPPMKCGVGDYTAKLANALARCNSTAVAVLTDAAATPVPAEFEFEVLPVARGWRMTDVGCIAKAVRAWKPDIVHVQYPTQGYGLRYLPWLLPAFFFLRGVPVVQTWHEYHFEKARRNLLNAMLGGGLIAVRPEYLERMPRWYRWITGRKHFEFIPSASAIPRVCLSHAEKLALKSRFVAEPCNLIVYFGFVYPAKRVELLFDIADPTRDHLVLICDLNPEVEHHRRIVERINQEPWSGKVTVTGFLPSAQVGSILAAADAVVLPFRDGGGPWNTSIHAALLQGTFVLTTSVERQGYDSSQNIYFAPPDDVPDMSKALRTFVTRRIPGLEQDAASDWEAIAHAHKSVYEAVLSTS